VEQKKEPKVPVALDPVKVEVLKVASPDGVSVLNFNGKIACS